MNYSQGSQWTFYNEAHRAGVDARYRGERLDANPHSDGNLRSAWKDGWEETDQAKAADAHVLLKCCNCDQKSYSTRERVDRYLLNSPAVILCPNCRGGNLWEVKHVAPAPLYEEPVLHDPEDDDWLDEPIICDD